MALKITAAEFAAVGNAWKWRMLCLRPKNVLELGTGQGAGGAQVMTYLEPDAVFTTINYVDGHQFGEQLANWRSDPRFKMLDEDTIDPKTFDMVPDGVDLLFIDSTHEAWHAAAELRMWQYKLVDGAMVIVDDLNQHDMAAFWESIPYDKSPEVYTELSPHQGVFVYGAAFRYDKHFDRPEKTTYDPRYQGRK